MLRVYFLEAAYRSAYQAKSEGSTNVSLEHVEKFYHNFFWIFNSCNFLISFTPFQ